MPARTVRAAVGALASMLLVAPAVQAAPALPPRETPKQAEAVGYGGAVSSVDPE